MAVISTLGLLHFGEQTVVISSNTQGANVRDLAVTQGWDTSRPLRIFISSGAVVGGNATSVSPGLSVSGDYPWGLRIINNGDIVGYGGEGGKGSGWVSPVGTASPGTNGFPGGAGLSVQGTGTIYVDNLGTISGGGGGGGGGRAGQGGGTIYMGAGGGGGGRGQAGGIRGLNGGSSGPVTSGGTAATNGTFTATGTGGNGAAYAPSGYYAGAGGNGGSFGVSGANGSNGVIASNPVPATFGGPGGSAVIGNSSITWITVGTRNGPIT